MRIHFYSPNRIEPWDHRNVTEIGIGGSETSHVEMATRLAARGHEVTSYTALPEPSEDYTWNRVNWRDLSRANLEEDGLWIVYRHPETGAIVKPTSSRRYWLICQDVWYPNYRSKDAAQFERIIGLCPRHIADMRRRDPEASDRIYMSSNGVNVQRFQQPGIERDPTRLIWASSPDRGLQETLDIFERAREDCSNLSLHIFYGMDNIDKICGGDRRKLPWRRSWEQYDRACAMEGVTWHGRVGQKQLAIEWLKSGIWLYPTWFSETSCISCMEAQVSGAIPITNPIWATGFNVRHGVFIEGDPADKLVKSRYVDAVVRIAGSPERQHIIRDDMIPESIIRLDWERFVDQWEEWMEFRLC